jgi:hypothetical protein
MPYRKFTVVNGAASFAAAPAAPDLPTATTTIVSAVLAGNVDVLVNTASILTIENGSKASQTMLNLTRSLHLEVVGAPDRVKAYIAGQIPSLP